MENNCKLHVKCLKKEESLEECNNPECQNVIHLSCFKKLLAAFSEDEWEGPLFCGKGASITTKKRSRWPQAEPKEECHGRLMVRCLKSNLCQ